MLKQEKIFATNKSAFKHIRSGSDNSDNSKLDFSKFEFSKYKISSSVNTI